MDGRFTNPLQNPLDIPYIGGENAILTARAWAEVRLEHLRHNAALLQSILPPGCKIMAVVKANAYGHGTIPASRCLEGAGIRHFAVATLQEGIALRKEGIRGEILILGYTYPDLYSDLLLYDLTQTVIDYAYAQKLNRYGKKIKVHVKIDSGMHRLGEASQNVDLLEKIYQMEHLLICGTYTHLGCCDSLEAGDVAYTNRQLQAFSDFVRQMGERGITVQNIHTQSSYAVVNYPQLGCSFARSGLFLYGIHKNDLKHMRYIPRFKPVLSVKSRVALTKTLQAGESAGYECNFTAKRQTRIAVVSIGFADGVFRSLSCNQGEALLRGRRVPIIGNICMDQLLLDISAVPEAQSGDIVTLLGKEGGEEITAQAMAEAAGTIPNELLSRLGERLCRVYIP